MSEPKLISPMLDGFVMGDPISDHAGVRCCPAMKQDTDDRYIVKIISNPASQKRLDALLLTGAYPDAQSAKVYFKELADGIVEEISILNQLSGSEGFLSFNDHQIVPMEDGETGYDVYLISDYRRTLERQFKRKPMTHLGTINLGLDICSALSVCRRAGYLYTDLKPSNIYVLNDKEYRIGDLGFIKLDSLKYASLPDKYRSSYTAPEITDAFSSLNTTIDIYALGLILYQAYNGGTLPVVDKDNPAEKFPAPEYADYEMSEIILKACDPDPEQRWQDPVQMGQALVSYMQRNGANDTPIVPPVVPIREPEEMLDTPEETGDETVVSEAEGIDILKEISAFDEPDADIPEDSESEATEISDEDALPEQAAQVSADEIETDTEPELSAIYAEDDFGNLSFLTDTDDETTQEVDAEQIEYEEISDEVSQMMAQIDEIAEHPVPEPVTVPDAVEVPIPEPVVLEDVPNEEQASESETATEQSEDDQPPEGSPDEEIPLTVQAEEEEYDDPDDPEASEDEDESPAPRKKHTLRNVLLIILALALLAGGFLFYKFFYLQRIDALAVEGDESSVTISVTSKTDEALLTVVCADAYGNKMVKPVSDGKVIFTDLLAGTEYTITVKIDGFHKLEGEYRKTYYTPNQTNIVQLSAITGSEEGSAIISFTIDGADSEQWQVTYSSGNSAAQTVTFSGHTATLTGLTVGEEYTATLTPVTELYLSGDQEITFTANPLVYAEDLVITSCKDNSLTAVWAAPEGVQVDSWSVHCYNDSGYNESVMTNETTITFEGIDDTQDYTVEVSASGQSVSQRTSVGENSITLDAVVAETNANGHILLSWIASDQIPQGGWLINYTIDENDTQFTIACEKNELVIKEAIPGHTYRFTIQSADETPVVCPPIICTTEAADDFSCDFGGSRITKQDISLSMCKTPDKENWSRNDLTKSDYTTTFGVGESASFVIRAHKIYGISDDEVTALYVIRDESGNILSFDYEAFTWRTLWDYYYGELNLPTLPSAAGSYTVAVYFNGDLVGEQNFTITE